VDDVKKTYREAETKTKEAWPNADGTSPKDALGNAGDELRKDAGNVGDDLRRTTDIDRPKDDLERDDATVPSNEAPV
jgi:hypothetical protein